MSLAHARRRPGWSPPTLPHEAETLVLAAFDAGARLLSPAALSALHRAIKEAGGVEAANSGPGRSPSKRLLKADSHDSKTVTGPLLIQDAGLPAILERRPAFAGRWEQMPD